MKNKNLNMLVKSSVFSRKLPVFFFCLFTMISTVLVLESVGIISPLRENIDNKMNNHISNRELMLDFDGQTSEEKIREILSDIEKNEHVSDVYQTPAELDVSEESGVLFSSYTLGYVHNGFTPNIISGRLFKETETEVAIVPHTLYDFNETEHKIKQIEGENLIGKTLLLSDECGNIHKARVIGTYDSSDPIFSGNEILIPQSDLLKYNDMVLNSSLQGEVSISSDKSYTILIDNSQNVDSVKEQLSGFCVVYQTDIGIDADSYNTALCILLGMLAFFIVLIISGFFMFLKNNVSCRTYELALYRALGYKSKQIFYIIFTEHLLLGILSIAIGIIITILLNSIFVNPYLFTLVGNTIMEMTVSITLTQIVFIIMLFILILLLVCRSAIKRSEKIDLTILLREQ